MKMTPKEYSDYVKKKSPPTPFIRDTIIAFLVGGGICTGGQYFLNLYKSFGLEKTDAGSATVVTMIFFGVLVTAFRVYDVIAKRAGAGTIVPITGFANAVASAAMEFKSEGFIFGMSSKMFTIAGPVLVYGISASVIYGIIYYILAR